MDYDVIIFGAGVAGLHLAHCVARKGFKTVLVESKPRDRIGEKPCGDAIGEHHFRELGLDPPGFVVEHRYRGVVIYGPSGDNAIAVPGSGVSLNRIRFGQWLLKNALDVGVELLDNHVFLDLRVAGDGVSEVYVREKGCTVRKTIKARVYVDATGAVPSFRTKLPVNWFIKDEPYKSEFNITYREILELDEPLDMDNNYAYIFLNQNIAPGGYWWVFPKDNEGRVVNTGLGVVWSLDLNPRAHYYESIKPKFKGKILHAGGGLVPTRRPLPTLVWRNVVVVGDSAYTVNPIHGGGIGSSLMASYYASKHICEALSKGVISEETLWGINVDYMLKYGAKQAFLDIVRMFLQKLSNDDLDWLINSKLISGRDVHELGYSGELGVPLIDKITSTIKLLSRPSLINSLRIVKKYADKMKNLYSVEYPRSPVGFEKWLIRVENTVSEYMSLINYDPGVKVSW